MQRPLNLIPSRTYCNNVYPLFYKELILQFHSTLYKEMFFHSLFFSLPPFFLFLSLSLVLSFCSITPFCLFLCLSHLPTCMCVCFSLSLCFYLCLSMSHSLSPSLSISPSLCLSVSLSLCLPVSLFLCLSVSLSLCLSFFRSQKSFK